jgi:antirestriction protein ArdC
LTYKQAAELGGQVRKGEKGSLVVYANRITKTATDDKGADVEIEIPFMKGYTGFFYAKVRKATRTVVTG